MTIAEIAARAGVSKTAVSRYLNDGYVSAEKREAIRRVIEETGYVPSRQAQMLRTGQSGLIGVILPRINSESIGRIVRGISRVLGDSRFQLLLANTDNHAEKELEYLEVFRKGRVDGILLVATMLTPAHRKAIRECQVPVVVEGQCLSDASCVYHDDQGAAHALTTELIEAGCRKIAYFGVTTRDKAAGLARRHGFLEALAEAEIPADDALMQTCDFSVESGTEACRNLLQNGTAFDGIFCATDSIAVGAMEALHEAGIKMPDEVKVVGVGHARISGLVRPKLTTAHYFYEKSGEEAARILLEIIRDGVDMHQQIKLGYEIVRRESTGH